MGGQELDFIHEAFASNYIAPVDPQCFIGNSGTLYIIETFLIRFAVKVQAVRRQGFWLIGAVFLSVPKPSSCYCKRLLKTRSTR
jgi:hypothetical protein